jgi:glucosamine--fructose-6-phosphate aminotransferase (isomerizing)
MCGIFGYVGHRTDAASIVFEGLKTLEYRGYDSWGIADTVGGKIRIERHVGKISQKNTRLGSSTIAIGHTRWATHGGVTEANAHPHSDCTGGIALLHNGIVENHAQLKQELVSRKHSFTSETDTEVIAHLIEEGVNAGRPISDALMHAFRRLEGLSAVVAIDRQGEEILAAKRGSPVIIGEGKGEYMIASDAAGILPFTNKLLFMEDDTMAILRRGHTIVLKDIPTGEEKIPVLQEVKWRIEQATKGAYKHYMLKEIHEQPTVIREIATATQRELGNIVHAIRRADRVYIIASGTAYHAGLYGVNVLARAGVEAIAAQASEFQAHEQFISKQSVIIALSQSGETIDVIEPLKRVKEKGAHIIALTNSLGSTLYRMADQKLLLRAGPEKAVASTKAYIAKLSILTLISSMLNDGYEYTVGEVLSSADVIESILKPRMEKIIKTIARTLAGAQHLYLIGRGISYATVLEGALKIKEISYIHAEGMAGGELKHGTIALIEKGTPCIVSAPDDEHYAAIISNATEIKARGGYIIGISSRSSEIFDVWIQLEKDSIAALTHIVPMQLLGYYLAIARKCDPDKPRNLAKSVTVK